MSFLIRWFLPLCSKMTWTFLVPGPQMSGLHAKLQGKVILLRSWVSLQLHPVSTLTPLGHTLAEPGPLDVGVLLITDTANHPVVVHGVDDSGIVLGSLGPLDCLQEERILVSGLLGQQFVFLQTSGVLQRVGHGQVSPEAGGDGQTAPGGGGHQLGEVPCQERHSQVSSESSRSLVEVNQAILAW